jgi:hypothetical protein
MMLSRMVARGELERVIHGVYATPSATGDEVSEKRAVWLSLDPARLAHDRLADSPPTGVISHASAAAMHGIGDILEPQVEVTLPARYRARRDELRAHRGVLRPDEVTIVDGLPVTTPARTVADLLRDGHDRDHVASVVADALERGLVSTRALEIAFDGAERGRTGREVLADLLAIAGIDPDSLMRAVITSKFGAAATRAAALQWLCEALKPSAPFREQAERSLAARPPGLVDVDLGDLAETWRNLTLAQEARERSRR